MHDHQAEMDRCIRDCDDCANTCLHEAAHCLEKGGRHTEPAHFRLMLDCAEMCRTSLDFMLRGSSLSQRVCQLCADVCEECARSCERLGDMPECVAACRRCAESCRRMGQARAA